MSGRLLVVDDDRAILYALRRLLGSRGYHVDTALSAEAALDHLERERIDLMLLDVGLPGRDGLTFCRQVRGRWRFPIIMVSARDGSTDKALGLEVGADDYVAKPFDPAELLARVRAQLRRAEEYSSIRSESTAIIVGELRIDAEQRQVFRGDRPIPLTEREFGLMHMLARNMDRALDRSYLFESVWGYDAEMSPKTLAVYIRRLRVKIERDPEHPEYLHTMRGFGYKLSAPGGQ